MNLKEQRKQEAKEANIVEKLKIAKSIVDVYISDDSRWGTPEAIHEVYDIIVDKKPAAIETFKSRLNRTRNFAITFFSVLPPEEFLAMHEWVDEADDEDFIVFVDDFTRARDQAQVAYNTPTPTLEMVLFVFDEFHGEGEEEA